jgi:hypothetical protein
MSEADFREWGWRSLWMQTAAKIYSHAINSLWIGNAGAALATLSFIGAAWKDGTFPRILLCPLSFFLLGLILMGIGSLLALWRVHSVLEKRNKAAETAIDVKMDDIPSPAEIVGLSIRDGRTIMALLSGICFVAGCVAGLVLLAWR